MLIEGVEAPDFTLPAHDGTQVTLSRSRGHWVVLWWFVIADTPG